MFIQFLTVARSCWLSLILRCWNLSFSPFHCYTSLECYPLHNLQTLPVWMEHLYVQEFYQCLVEFELPGKLWQQGFLFMKIVFLISFQQPGLLQSLLQILKNQLILQITHQSWTKTCFHKIKQKFIYYNMYFTKYIYKKNIIFMWIRM